MRVAFVLQDLQLSGGVGVVVEHARNLRRDHGIDARLVLGEPETHPRWGYPGLDDLPVLDLGAATACTWDVAVATWWKTTSSLFHLPAARYAYFVQALEDSFYPPDAPERLAAGLTTALPVSFITEARWIADMLDALQPGTPVHYVRNGIPKAVFASPRAVAPALPGEPLRVVIEGAAAHRLKGIGQTLDVVARLREPAHVTWVGPDASTEPEGVTEALRGLSHPEMAALLARSHVLLKLSRAEGMYGPPLEGFHMGATVVTTPVTGHDEFVRHRRNGLVVGWDDVPGTARAVDLLARDRRLLHELRCGALATAQAWPDWRASSQWLALALRRIAAEPPALRGAGLRLSSELATVTSEAQLAERRLRDARHHAQVLFQERAYRYAVRARRQLERVRRVVRRVRR